MKQTPNYALCSKKTLPPGVWWSGLFKSVVRRLSELQCNPIDSVHRDQRLEPSYVATETLASEGCRLRLPQDSLSTTTKVNPRILIESCPRNEL